VAAHPAAAVEASTAAVVAVDHTAAVVIGNNYSYKYQKG
jgi:hypothetical protein